MSDQRVGQWQENKEQEKNGKSEKPLCSAFVQRNGRHAKHLVALLFYFVRAFFFTVFFVVPASRWAWRGAKCCAFRRLSATDQTVQCASCFLHQSMRSAQFERAQTAWCQSWPLASKSSRVVKCCGEISTPRGVHFYYSRALYDE